MILKGDGMTAIKIPDTIYDRARRLALVQKREIDEIVTEILDKGLPEYGEQDERARRQQEIEAFRQLHPQLFAQYPGEYVAIYNSELVDHDIDRNALMKRIYQNYPDVFVLIRPVNNEPEIVYSHISLRWAE